MNHNDHVNLLKPADLPPGGVWADLGAGEGAFTLALRELVGPEAEIYAVDKNRGRLKELERVYKERFGATENLHLLEADFSRALSTSTSSVQRLPPLDGAMMANSLHFFKDREKVLSHVGTFLKPDGLLLLVEYNVDRGNMWVPHPLSFKTYHEMAPRAGFTQPRLLAKHPSSFLREFYSALTKRN